MVGASPLDKAPIFEDVPFQEIRDDPLVGVGAADWLGLQQQENTPSGVAVGVFLAADLMNELVAECHAGESALATDGLGGGLVDHGLDATLQSEVFWVGQSVDQKRPVDVASFGELIAGERTKDNDACILGVQSYELWPQFGLLRLRAVAGCENVGPAGFESMGELVKEGG